MTTAYVAERGEVNESGYRSFLAEFQAAYRKMKDASETVNAVFEDALAGVAPDQGTSQMATAAEDYEDARQSFLLAAAKLNDRLIAEIPSVPSAVQLPARPDPVHR